MKQRNQKRVRDGTENKINKTKIKNKYGRKEKEEVTKKK
jgi:hypothetical protein